MIDANQNETVITRRFCSRCGAKLDSGACFCSICGAKQIPEQPAETEILTPPAPDPHFVPKPQIIPEPIPAAAPVTRNSFPIAALILTAIAAIYYLVDAFSSYDLVRSALYFIPYILMILGLCFFRGSRNVLFGVAFLVMGGGEFLFWVFDVFGNGYYHRVSLGADILFYLPQLIFTAMIGIPYLTGSGKATKNAFAIWSIVLTLHILAFNYIQFFDFYSYYPSATTDIVLGFALCSLPTMLAALFYTPFGDQ